MGALFGLLGALSIGASDLFARRVVRDGSALTASVVVSLVAIVTSIVSVVLFGSTLLPRDLVLGLFSGLGLGAGLFTYYGGIARSSATVVAPLVAALSAIIPYGYALTKGASPSGLAIAGAVVALVGVVAITVGGGKVAGIHDGVLWGTASGLAYGFGFAVVLEASEGSGAWPAVGQRTMAFAVLSAAAVKQAAPLWAPEGTRVAGWLGGILAGLATVFYLAGIQHDATATVILTSMFPAASVAVGSIFFGDAVNRRQALGIAIVLAGTIAVVTG